MDCDFAAAVLSLDTGCPMLDPLKQAGADTNKVVKMFLTVGGIFNGKKTMRGKIFADVRQLTKQRARFAKRGT